MSIKLKIPNQNPEDSLSPKCSCLQCDSFSCFTKRRDHNYCSCQLCDKSKTCICKTEQRGSTRNISDKILATYLNAAKPKANREIEELTENEMNYESERKTLLEINQPPPHSLDEYLNRLPCVSKASSKFKQKPTSLSGYIDVISENTEYKKKLKLFKGYVQSLKEAKSSNLSQDVNNAELLTDSLHPQQWYSNLSEISGKRSRKCKGQCKFKCLVKQEPTCKNIAQIRSAMISCALKNKKFESARLNTQASVVPCGNCNDSCRTSNNFFKYDILKLLKEAYIACSCKVCECISPKLNNNDICKCKPCQCVECKGYSATQSQVPKVSSTITCSCNVHNDETELQTPKKQEGCSCVPCECDICRNTNIGKNSDNMYKPLQMRQPLVVASVTQTVCTCLPCNCKQCVQSYTAFQTYFDKKKYESTDKNSCIHPKASINEIYRHENNKNRKNKHDFVALYSVVPRINSDFKTKIPKACICKECECITCVCKDDTINGIKSSGFFSTIGNSSNNQYYRVCKYCSQKRDLHRIFKWGKRTFSFICDDCNRLSHCSSNPKSHLNYCRCTNCRCERCVAHGINSNYPSTVGTSLVKKGDVLSPSAHQTKIQKLKLEGKRSTAIIHKYESLTRDFNFNVKSEMEDKNYHGVSKNNPRDVTSRPSVSRQAKRDMGTILTASFNRWKIAQCDAFVHSQEFNITKPILKNNFTTSCGSICSITALPSEDNDNVSSISENNKKSLKITCHKSGHDHSEHLKQFSELAIGNELDLPKNLKLNTSTTIQGLENMILEKQEHVQSPRNISTEVTSLQNNQIENVEGTYSYGRILKDEIKILNTNNCFLQPSNDMFTETTSLMNNDSESKDGSSYVKLQPKTSNKNGTHDTNESLLNVNSKNKLLRISEMNLKNAYQPTKSLSTSAVTTLEKLFLFNSEQTSNHKSGKSSMNSGNNFNCFRVLQNLEQSNFIGNIYNHYKPPKPNKSNLITNGDLFDINNNNRRARKTLEDAKKFSLHLLSLLEMYEKANNEFVKISDELKAAYRSVLDRKGNHSQDKNNHKLENFNVKKDNESHSPFEETTPTLNTKVISKSKPVSFEHIFTKRLDNCRTTSNHNSSNTDFEILEKVSKANSTGSKDDGRKKCERICYANVKNEYIHMNSSSRNLKKKITPKYDRKMPIKTVAEITRYADLKEDYDHLSRSTSTETIIKYAFKPTVNEEVETKMDSICKKSFGFTAKPNIITQAAGMSEVPSLEVDTQYTMSSISVQNNTTNTIENERFYHGNKALSQLQLEVRKLLELAILEPLNGVEDTEDSMLESSSIFDQSILNMDIQEPPKANKSIHQHPEHIDKEVFCSDQKLLDEFKKQIREQLKVASMHPLMNKTSSLASYSCNSECEDLKARFLVVRKISEHTALLRWSQPRGLGVQGYELLVDGRTVQKILNPSKCITAVTCLPHTDKILLTIRTIMSVMPEVGHYPTTTIIYRPHQQQQC